MGDRSGTGHGGTAGGGDTRGGDGGDIDWSAVFNGLATATAAPNPFSSTPLHDQTQEQSHYTATSTSVWDHLFPPPVPTGLGRTEPLSTSSTPRTVEAGPSRPRHVANAQSFSAPITPDPQYTNQADFFARLSQSIYGFDDQHHQQGQAPSSIPPPGNHSVAHLDLEERLRKNAGNSSVNNVHQARHEAPSNGTSSWQDTSSSLENIPLPLPPPHASFVRPHLPTRSQSLSTWQAVSTPGPSIGSGSFTPPHPPSTSSSSTPTVPPPGTPLQPVAEMTPGGALDTEDKRQRNTLASAKFRAKRKKHMANISQRITELEGEQTSLTRDVADLKQENKFLREMVEIKYGLEAKSVNDPRSGGNPDDPNGITPRSSSHSPRAFPSPSPRHPEPAQLSSPRALHSRYAAPSDVHSQSYDRAEGSQHTSLHPENQAPLGSAHSAIAHNSFTAGVSPTTTLSSLLNAQGEWEMFQSQYEPSLQPFSNSPRHQENLSVEQDQSDLTDTRAHGSFPLSMANESYPHSQSHRPP